MEAESYRSRSRDLDQLPRWAVQIAPGESTADDLPAGAGQHLRELAMHCRALAGTMTLRY
jgi:hypothetical protein